MVMEVSEQDAVGQAAAKPRDRWTDAYANQPVRRMVALYDYDPQELSPNVDADVSIFKCETTLTNHHSATTLGLL